MGVYRPSSGKLERAIDILLGKLESTLGINRQIVIMGDINVDNLVDDANKAKIEELTISFNITRLILPPTRITKDTAKSIDWICTNIDLQQFQPYVLLTGLPDCTALQVIILAKTALQENYNNI